MALIKCPNCGGFISEFAHRCFHCGLIIDQPSLYDMSDKESDNAYHDNETPDNGNTSNNTYNNEYGSDVPDSKVLVTDSSNEEPCDNENRDMTYEESHAKVFKGFKIAFYVFLALCLIGICIWLYSNMKDKVSDNKEDTETDELVTVEEGQEETTPISMTIDDPTLGPLEPLDGYVITGNIIPNFMGELDEPKGGRGKVAITKDNIDIATFEDAYAHVLSKENGIWEYWTSSDPMVYIDKEDAKKYIHHIKISLTPPENWELLETYKFKSADGGWLEIKPIRITDTSTEYIEEDYDNNVSTQSMKEAVVYEVYSSHWNGIRYVYKNTEIFSSKNNGYLYIDDSGTCYFKEYKRNSKDTYEKEKITVLKSDNGTMQEIYIMGWIGDKYMVMNSTLYELDSYNGFKGETIEDDEEQDSFEPSENEIDTEGAEWTESGYSGEPKFVEPINRPVQFEGGENALYAFMSDHMTYPSVAAEENIQGTVVIRAYIDEEGRVYDVEVLRGKHPALDKESMRVIKKLPPFLPQIVEGKPVKSTYDIPVRFKLY